jgi:4-amino-4-deoxy-L-arabinose transferase-like glycosyltransferase
VRDSKWLYIFIFFIFFLLRIWGLHFGLPFEGIHPTEYFSISQSLQYLTTGNLKPLDFQHPTLFQYLISFISRVIFLPARDCLYFYLLARFISCLASFFSVYFLYRLTKELLNSNALGLLGAGFLGFNLLSVKYAHYATPDSLSLLFLVLTIIFSFKILKMPRLKNYLLCALFCGLSTGSKFSGLMSAGFLFCAHLSFFKDKKQFSHLKLILALLIVILTFLVTSPYHLLYLKEALQDGGNYLVQKGYFEHGSIKARGFFIYPFILLPDTFGFWGLVFATLGLGIMFLQDKRKTALLFIPTFIYFLIIGAERGGTLQNLLPILPILSLFASQFFLSLKERGIKKLYIVSLVALVLLPNSVKTLIFDYYILKPDTRLLAQQWLMQNVKGNAKIGFERYSPFDLNYIGKSPVKERFNSTYFVPSLSIYPASFYKNEGYDYIITSNFREDSYAFFCRTERACQPIENYSSYAAQLQLAAVFATPLVFKLTGVSLPWGTWPHQPTIKIYKVK